MLMMMFCDNYRPLTMFISKYALEICDYHANLHSVGSTSDTHLSVFQALTDRETCKWTEDYGSGMFTLLEFIHHKEYLMKRNVDGLIVTYNHNTRVKVRIRENHTSWLSVDISKFIHNHNTYVLRGSSVVSFVTTWLLLIAPRLL